MLENDYFFIRGQGGEVIEQYNIQNYNLYLIEMSPFMANYCGCKYQVAFSRNDTSFIYHQFDKRSPKQSPPLSQMILLINKIKEWVKKYGEVSIGSQNKNKLDTYMRIFDRFKIPYIVKEIPPIDFRYLVISFTSLN